MTNATIQAHFEAVHFVKVIDYVISARSNILNRRIHDEIQERARAAAIILQRRGHRLIRARSSGASTSSHSANTRINEPARSVITAEGASGVETLIIELDTDTQPFDTPETIHAQEISFIEDTQPFDTRPPISTFSTASSQADSN